MDKTMKGEDMNLSSKEIIKLLTVLVGETEARGETNADELIEKNLDALIDVGDWCIANVIKASGTKDRHEYSMMKIGKKASATIREWEEWLASEVND